MSVWQANDNFCGSSNMISNLLTWPMADQTLQMTGSCLPMDNAEAHGHGLLLLAYIPEVNQWEDIIT